MKITITPALRELRAAITEAEEITAKAEMTKRDEARTNVLLAKIAALRQNAVAADDYAFRWMRDYIRGAEPETRTTDMLAGSQSITAAQGQAGGWLVPSEFHDSVLFGMAQYDPLLDENLVTLVRSPNFSLRPYKVPAWDLSTFAATKVAEGSQQTPLTVPTASNAQLNGYAYRATLDASFELEEDDFQPTINQMAAAFAIAQARGIGADLIDGNGTTAPQGVLTGAHNSGITTANSGTLIYSDFDNIYFAVNRAYRQSKKCAWVISDAVYQMARKAIDGNGRPLISELNDEEQILGKPVLVSPSVPDTAGSTGIIFGDLSHYVVRVSRMVVTRNLQAPGYVEYGKGLYTARMRADAKVVDPTGGNTPPIVYATLHA